jgi:hypothetical protein
MKLCGNLESCFVRGECWGHLEGIVCAYQEEREEGITCGKTKEQVQAYYSKEEYEELKQQENKDAN